MILQNIWKIVIDNVLIHIDLSYQASGEREQVVSGNALDHLAIRVGPLAVVKESEAEQWVSVSIDTLDHSAIKAGLIDLWTNDNDPMCAYLFLAVHQMCFRCNKLR